jgi:c-di-GMP-binding flagellar brake protein YcgR
LPEVNYLDYIKVNKLIDLEIDINSANIEQKDVFPSRVEDIRRDKIIVAAPYKKGSPVPVPVGEEVLIRVGKDGTYYSFHTKTLGRQGGLHPVLELSLPFRITKIQMRNWVRVGSHLPVSYRILGSEDDYIISHTLDVSGGGLCLLAKQPLETDTLLELIINFPDNFAVNTKGIVRRCMVEERIIKLGVCFHEISERLQDRIVNYVFKKQREYIQKGIAKPTLP